MTVRSERRSNVIALGLWVSIIVVGLPARAQQSPLPAPEKPGAAEASPEQAEIDRKTVEVRSRLEEWQAKAAEYLLAGQEADARTHAIDQEIARLQQRDTIAIPGDASAADLNRQLREAEQDLVAARREASDLDVEGERRAERRKRIPELLSIAKRRLKELDGAPPPVSGESSMAESLRELDALKRRVAQIEIEAYQNELGSYDARGTMLSKQRDRATLRIAYYAALSSKVRGAKQELERLEVERENEATRQLLAELTAVPAGFRKTLQELYERNEALASIWTSEGGLQEQIEDVSEKLSRAEAKVAQLEAELTRLAARVQAVGLADSIGVLLRRHRAEAPDIGMYRRFIRMRQEQIGDVQLQQIKLREQRQALADIDALVDEAMASIEEPVPPAEQQELQNLFRQLFETQRKYMDALIEDYETYFQKLVDFDAQQQELIARTKDLLDFIDERILWVPSGRAVQPELLSDGGDAVAWLLGAKYLAQLGRGVRDAAMRLWPVNLLALLLTILFVPFVRRVRPRIQSLGAEAKKPDCTRFGPTSEALALTLLLAVWLPALLAYAGWRLGLSPVATHFSPKHCPRVACGGWLLGDLALFAAAGSPRGNRRSALRVVGQSGPCPLARPSVADPRDRSCGLRRFRVRDARRGPLA